MSDFLQDIVKTGENYGKTTKHGPEQLRTAFIQLVMGMQRIHEVQDYRLMKLYKVLQGTKGSGKAIIATARKLTIAWHMLTYNDSFDASLQIVMEYECKSLPAKNIVCIFIALPLPCG